MASGENQKLDYGRELVYVDQKDQLLGRLLKRVIDGVNQLAKIGRASCRERVYGTV